MSGQFEEYGKSLGYAAAGLTTAVVGLSLASLAAMHAALVAPVILELTYKVSREFMDDAHKHLVEARQSTDVQAESHNQKYLS